MTAMTGVGLPGLPGFPGGRTLCMTTRPHVKVKVRLCG